MACFADISVSQGSVGTYARCGGIFNISLTTNLQGIFQWNFFWKSVKIWQNYGHESVAQFFLAHPAYEQWLSVAYLAMWVGRVDKVQGPPNAGAAASSRQNLKKINFPLQWKLVCLDIKD